MTEPRRDRRLGVRALTGSSAAIRRVREQVHQLAATRVPVLIEGEMGTGKNLAARALHQDGPRRERPFRELDVRSWTETMAERELFGAEPGAQVGALERADGGSVALESIEFLGGATQLRLLRYLEERTFERTGDGTARRSDVRVIGLTSRDLAEEVRAGRFRADLFEHFALTRVRLPPLRERLDDLPLLVEEGLRWANRTHARRVPGVTAGLLDRLARHDWPGNVRELYLLLEGMVVQARGRKALDVTALPEPWRAEHAPDTRVDVGVGMTLADIERRVVEATLAHTGGDKRRAAALLGIGLRTLYRRLDEWGLGGS